MRIHLSTRKENREETGNEKKKRNGTIEHENTSAQKMYAYVCVCVCMYGTMWYKVINESFRKGKKSAKRVSRSDLGFHKRFRVSEMQSKNVPFFFSICA